MAVSEYALTYHYGDSFSGITWEWRDSSNNPKDITGYLASLKVKDENGTEYLHLDSDSNGGLTVVGASGQVVLNASPTLMTSGSLVAGTNYEYDIQVKSSDGSIIQTLTKGPFRVDEEITDV